MKVANRVVLLGIALLVSLPAPALASCEIVIEHNWSVVGPGGHYGIFQYQTGPRPFNASTAVLLGPHHFQIPAPLFAILAGCGLPVLGIIALCLRGGIWETEAATERDGSLVGMARPTGGKKEERLVGS
jgi:hypothetical protein